MPARILSLLKLMNVFLQRISVSQVALALGIWASLCPTLPADKKESSQTVDFNRDIRPILSRKCFTCHGPDKKNRQAGLRLDVRNGALADRGGHAAIVPGHPEKSELIRRINSPDEETAMPPQEAGKELSAQEKELLKNWIAQGAPYARHWSYTPPVRPPLPMVQNTSWPRNEIDYFILSRLEREGLTPSPEADRYALIRRLSLDLTGLPPTLEEVERFVNDTDPDAYEKLVDRLLAKDAYGEHWARMWLDLARYADSAGYADDPPRTIWAYRDYVIRSLNKNKPFHQFTVEQIAGDLLPDPTKEQLVATAFHRNTMTNNEGGTNDEEFRNVAVVDRVNTTMSVWMGTTMACAQCHDHKYDPISQEEYFRFFAFFNNTADADKRNESPLLDIYTDEQKKQKARWQQEIAQLEQTLRTPTPELQTAQEKWEQQFSHEPRWQSLAPKSMKSRTGVSLSRLEDDSILVEETKKQDVYTLKFPVERVAPARTDKTSDGQTKVTSIRLGALPHESLPGKGPGHASGNFVLSQVHAAVVPPEGNRLKGRYVRIEIPGKKKILSLAEVQVFQGGKNVAPEGTARQSSVDYDGPARLAIDDNTNGHYYNAQSTTHTKKSNDPWWEVDLKNSRPLDRIVLWNRTDNGLHTRLKNFRIVVLNEQREPVWEKTTAEPPNPPAEYTLSGTRDISFAAAYADHSQDGFAPENAIDGKTSDDKGWAIAPQTGQPHTLTLIPQSPVEIPAGSQIELTLEQLSKNENHTLGRFRLSVTDDPHIFQYAQTPQRILALLQKPAEKRTEAEKSELTQYYLTIAPALQEERQRLAKRKKQLSRMKPHTTVPVMQRLPEDKLRTTRIQHRGNFLDTGQKVTQGVPETFHSLPAEAPRNRLTLARWLVDDDNPLTARVLANRFWEKIFGTGLVATSEDFGSQGELPSHPQLLDWLATELVRNGWDMKQFLRLLVTSSAYRQSSRVTPGLLKKDPENRLLARGPRFRLPAETIRDQALFVSGLLSQKMYGPPVKPPQPNLGLKAAFGSGIDWKTSLGEDRYRRGLYTMWRRSNPYPSMVAFDAPNREVCTLQRERTNTPLQALVTLNDPVYVEAAQALARRMAQAGSSPAEKARFGFRLCLTRPPSDTELDRLVRLYQKAHKRYSQNEKAARQMVTQPLGPVPEGSNVVDLAAWTVVGNVLLNLDEMLMKR